MNKEIPTGRGLYDDLDALVKRAPEKKFEIWEPVPDEFAPADQDMSVGIWRRGRKTLVFYLSCYGTCHANVGLRNPPGGVVKDLKFEDAWEWFCSENEELPNLQN